MFQSQTIYIQYVSSLAQNIQSVHPHVTVVTGVLSSLLLASAELLNLSNLSKHSRLKLAVLVDNTAVAGWQNNAVGEL